MEDDDDAWKTRDEKVSKIVEDYFSSIFISFMPNPNAMRKIVDGLTLTLPYHKRVDLERPFTQEDIQKALFDMCPSKSLGIDGFHPMFFQHC